MTHILVVDINATTAYRVKKLLEDVAVDVINATTMYEAVNRVGSLQLALDMVVIDVNLGPEDGYDLISKLKEINPNLVVIIVTSLNTRKSFVKAVRVGANDYILKPFDDEYFRKKILLHINQIDNSKALPAASAKQVDTSIYNAVKKAVRENHELLVGLLVVYNKNNPALTSTSVRDIALVKGLFNELSDQMTLEDEIIPNNSNSFVIVMHRKNILSKPIVIQNFVDRCNEYFIKRNVSDISFEIEFVNLPNEIDPRQNALTVLARKIEQKL